MAKKAFKMPMLILSGWGGEGGDTGLGSGGTSDDITACSFEEWLEMYIDDYSGPNDNGVPDGNINRDDYHYWWFEIAHLSQEAWDAMNGSANPDDFSVELHPEL